METCTEQEIDGYLYWLQEQYNRPSRQDYYLMRIAQEVARVLSSKPNEVTMDRFLIEFDTKPKKPPTQEEIAEKKKAISDAYRAALGIKTSPQKPKAIKAPPEKPKPPRKKNNRE